MEINQSNTKHPDANYVQPVQNPASYSQQNQSQDNPTPTPSLTGTTQPEYVVNSRSRGSGRRGRRGKGRKAVSGTLSQRQNAQSNGGQSDQRVQEKQEMNMKDYVRLIPLPKYREYQQQQLQMYQQPQSNEWLPVRLSEIDKATPMKLDEDKMSVTSWKGYRMARSTHGSHVGTWFYEVLIEHLGETGHCRVGWSTKKAELQAPVGYDKFGYSYRDVDGSKYHQAWRSQYGSPYCEGDVVGCLLHLPPGGLTLEKGKEDIVRWKSQYCIAIEDDLEPTPLPESFVAFYKNGEYQGKAFTDIFEGTYYAAVSMFTMPEQVEGASLRINVGPEFKFPPQIIEGVQNVKSLSELAGEPPIKEEEGQGQKESVGVGVGVTVMQIN
eukprot:TRINITY_DN6583_c0_g1_i3.p1 TRINITY_DN6583_c0_g1~~TRINITY_DN6583_c0_g1_i3.p1  ORF type:complete len:381 (-),score=58.62 TRINITY_DN6583_c0_g1_i3:332-1474(-)